MPLIILALIALPYAAKGLILWYLIALIAEIPRRRRLLGSSKHGGSLKSLRRTLRRGESPHRLPQQ